MNAAISITAGFGLTAAVDRGGGSAIGEPSPLPRYALPDWLGDGIGANVHHLRLRARRACMRAMTHYDCNDYYYEHGHSPPAINWWRVRELLPYWIGVPLVGFMIIAGWNVILVAMLGAIKFAAGIGIWPPIAIFAILWLGRSRRQ